MTARVAGAGLMCAFLLGLGAGCGDDGGGGSLPTLRPSISPTRTLPTPTRTPTRTGEPTDQPTEEPTQAPTQAPTEQPTEQPTPTPTPEPSEQPTTQEPTPSPTEEPSDRPTQQPTDKPSQEPTTAQPTEKPSEEPTEPATEPTTGDATEEVTPTESTGNEEKSAADESGDEGAPSWVWWLLAAVVVAAGVLAWVLVARSARRRAWQARLGAAEAEVAWLARELLPQLRDTGSLDQVAGGWQVARSRVAEAEDQLTVLASSAKHETDRGRASRLRDAVRDARSRVEATTTGVPRETWPQDLDSAIAGLESALALDPGGQP